MSVPAGPLTPQSEDVINDKLLSILDKVRMLTDNISAECMAAYLYYHMISNTANVEDEDALQCAISIFSYKLNAEDHSVLPSNIFPNSRSALRMWEFKILQLYMALIDKNEGKTFADILFSQYLNSQNKVNPIYGDAVKFKSLIRGNIRFKYLKLDQREVASSLLFQYLEDIDTFEIAASPDYTSNKAARAFTPLEIDIDKVCGGPVLRRVERPS